MTRFIYFILAYLFTSSVHSQNITISGYVKDGVSKETLIGASIVNAKTKIGTSANPYGYYSLTVNGADTIESIISCKKYKLQDKKITSR